MTTKLFDRAIVSNAQEALDFIGNILESSTEYSIIGKDLDGNIVLWNEGARRLYGYEASRLMGATVIITGLSADIARTLVTLGVDLGKMDTMGDLQEGIEEAERLLGYEIRRRTPVPDEEEDTR